VACKEPYDVGLEAERLTYIIADHTNLQGPMTLNALFTPASSTSTTSTFTMPMTLAPPNEIYATLDLL